MLSAKNKFEIARNRSCSSIRENLMCSSVILKNSSCLLKSSPAFESATQVNRQGEGIHGEVFPGEGLQDEVASPEEAPLRERSAKELQQYVHTSGVPPDDGAAFMPNEWPQDHDVNNEFKNGILYDRIVMSNGTYNTAVDSVHSNFQTNKLENVVNSIKFEENTSIKIPSYLRSSPLYVLYPELGYLQGGREERKSEGRSEARSEAGAEARSEARCDERAEQEGASKDGAQLGGRDDAGGPAQSERLPNERLSNERSPPPQNNPLNSYLRYALNSSHTSGRNRMHDYFESSKKNMVEIANPNDLNHTLLYTKKSTPTDLIFNLYKNRYVTSSSNHTDNELSTLKVLKGLKMPIIEKNEKGENITIASEVNAKRRVNLIENEGTSADTNRGAGGGAKQVSRGGKPNLIVSLIDVSSSDKASLKTVHLEGNKTAGEKKKIFQLKKKTSKDVQVQTNDGDFEEAEKCCVDSDVERVVSILEGKKKKVPPEDSQGGSPPRKGGRGRFSILYSDVRGPGESGEETPSGSGDAEEGEEADEGGEVDEGEAERRANPSADAMTCNSVSRNGRLEMTQAVENYNQFLRRGRARGGLNGTVLKKQSSGPLRSGPLIWGEAHLNGAKASPSSGNNGGKEPSGWDGSPPRGYNPTDKLTMGWSIPQAKRDPPPYLGAKVSKALLLQKVPPPWVYKTPGETPTSAPLTGFRIHRGNSPTDRVFTNHPSVGKLPHVCPNELRYSEPRPSRVCVYIKSSPPGGGSHRCDTDQSGDESKSATACDEEYVKEKIPNDLLLKKLYIQKKRQLYERRKFERAIASMLERRAMLRERARDKYSALASIHGGGSGHGDVGGGDVGSDRGDESPSSAERDRATPLRTLRWARGRPNRAYRPAHGSRAWRDTTLGGYQNGHVSSCSNVHLYSSNEESDGAFGKRAHNAARNCSARDGRRGVGSQLAERGEQNCDSAISPRTPLEAAAKERRSDKLANERSKGGAPHKFSPKFSPQSWRLRSLSYKNRVSKLSVLEKSIQPFKERAKRNELLGGNKSDEGSDIIRREIKKCVERGGYGESGDETEEEPSGGSTDAGEKHLMKENQSEEDDQTGGIKITYNLGKIVKRGNPTPHEWVNTENAFSPPLSEAKGRTDERQHDGNEEQTDEHICKRGDEKRESSLAEKKNTMGMSSATNGDFQKEKTNKSDSLFRVKVTIKKAHEVRSEIDKRSSNPEEGSNPNRFVLHENVQGVGSSSYKGNTNNGCITRTGLAPKEKGNFSDTEVATRKRNSERPPKKGAGPNDPSCSRTFLRKNDGHGGGDYLKIKQKETANMRSHSHSKFSIQVEESKETLPGIEFTPKCNSPLCRGRSNEADRLQDLERIDPNKWIQKIFGDTH
ncbi:conserved Plasmodium protein, unknown function [Plasmodium vivax]|uniref:Uncharacterized protein n=1 Tax=Plasmodium vivax TaxID=5855 RepID=A0A1G4HCR8_PLAVI|nr:conserved Plasmodium protein, unknown function [Plasmodium vivax]